MGTPEGKPALRKDNHERVMPPPVHISTRPDGEAPAASSVSPVSPIAAISSGGTGAVRESDGPLALEERHQALVLATGQMTWMARDSGGDGGDRWDGDGHDWRLFTGQDTETAGTRGWLDVLHPDDRERVAAAWNAVVAAKGLYEIEYRVRRRDGEYRWLLVRGVPVLAADGGVREWVGTATDITERKQAEDALRESEARLAAELADMRQIQRISTQLIREGDLDALYEQILAAAVTVMRSDMGSMQMLVPERNELRLLAWKGFDPASAAFWEWVRVDSGSSCGVALRTGERVLVADVEACDFMAGTQDLVFYRLSGIKAVQSTPLVSREGRVVGMISTHWREIHQPAERELRLLDMLARQAADLIERTQAEEALRMSGVALQEANRRKDDFLGIASHELRTPLTTITANVQMAERTLGALSQSMRAVAADAALDRRSVRLEQLRVLLERTGRQVGRLDRLVGDLLDVSRIQAGKLDMRTEECDLVAIVRDAVREQRAAGPHRSIALRVPRRTSLRFIADADRIGQVVTNYLTNALKYSAPHQPVTVSVRAARGQARVEVRDAGPGLTPEQQAHLFEQFYRVPGIEQQSGAGLGLGLGLHICKRIVERHGGTVGVESAPGAGSTFWFTLPLEPAPPEGMGTLAD